MIGLLASPPWIHQAQELFSWLSSILQYRILYYKRYGPKRCRPTLSTDVSSASAVSILFDGCMLLALPWSTLMVCIPLCFAPLVSRSGRSPTKTLLVGSAANESRASWNI